MSENETTKKNVDETLRRGLEELYAAEILSDDNSEDGYKTGKPFYLMPAGEMSRAVNRDSSPVYFDNNVFYNSGTEGSTDVTITGASIRPNKIAELLAKHIDSTTGAQIDTGEYTEKYFALGGTTNNVDGTSEKFWFAKGTFSLPSRSDKTKDDSTDTNGDELNFTAIRTQHKFDIGSEKKTLKKVVIDSSVTKVKENADWYAQVVTPDNIATVCEKIAE